MSRRFLLMVSTIAGLAMLAALVLFPLMTMTRGDESESRRAIEGDTGPWLLLFSWFACAFAALVFLKKADYIGIAENRCRMFSLLGYKLAGFFFLALLIAGTPHEKASWGFGFWLGFIASIVGSFAMYLTFNEKLAQKLADKAKDVSSGSSDAPKADA
jgi:hypothetical protein